MENDGNENGGLAQVTVRIRFFARFRELFGPEISTDPKLGTTVADLILEVVRENRAGYAAIFDDAGAFRDMVIIVRNGARLDTTGAAATRVAEGDEIAIFPPVAGG